MTLPCAHKLLGDYSRVWEGGLEREGWREEEEGRGRGGGGGGGREGVTRGSEEGLWSLFGVLRHLGSW